MDPRLRQRARRQAERQNEQVAAAAAMPQVFNGTVTAVAAGAGTDGNATITIQWFGGTFTTQGHGASYTPTVGDRVLCTYIDNQIGVVDKWVGFP